MDTIQTIVAYIRREKIRNANRYQIDFHELVALKEMEYIRPYEALCIAYDYGRAKGYRAAKAEARAAK